MISIRLQRGGRTHNPIYTIVAADSRRARDGRFLEKLGQYSPNNETVLSGVKVDRISAWVAKGAQMSDTVRTLLKKEKVEITK